MKSGFEVPWYSCVPPGTVDKNNDIPLWFKLPPHCRIEEWTTLKMWFALLTAALLGLAKNVIKTKASDETGISRRILTRLRVSAVCCSQSSK